MNTPADRNTGRWRQSGRIQLRLAGCHDLPVDIDLDLFKKGFETVHRDNHIYRTRIAYLEPHGTVQVVTKDDP